MFYQQSTSRVTLGEWVTDILDWITPPSSNRAPLDILTATEILDLTYSEGGELSESVAAHALYPVNLEQDEAYRVFGVTSSMEVIFPIAIEEKTWSLNLALRAGIPSMLAIGEGNIFPRKTPQPLPPSAMLSPRINGTLFKLREPSGNRLRTLAGPMGIIDKPFSVTGREAVKGWEKTLTVSPVDNTLSYIDDSGRLRQQASRGNLRPIADPPKHIRSFYLRQRFNRCDLLLKVSCKRLQPNQALMTISLKNLSSVPEDRAQRAADTQLSALILPHLRITLAGARAIFPTQQYAEAKMQALSIYDKDEMRIEAERRLYQVKQSGCITTCTPGDSTRLAMTTFGVFDTPREIPVEGPSVSELTLSPDSLLSHFTRPNAETTQFIQGNWKTVQAVLLSAAEAFSIQQLHRFQWDAIAKSIELQAAGRRRIVTIVRAPTGAGKTIVFMVNAAISSLCGEDRSTSVLLFPTRILNEDMFRRLTAFVHRIRENIPRLAVTGGIIMGTSDSLYKLLLNPSEGDIMHHYGDCPACRDSHLVARKISSSDRLLPYCPKCGHTVDYMFSPKEATTYLPDLLIATPDMVFMEATYRNHERYHFGLFGAPVRRCEDCGRAHAEAWFTLKPEKNRCRDVFSKEACPGTFSTQATSKPIKYIGFDEVHSLYGETATFLSVFLATLEAMQRVLSGQSELNIRFEAATATIANETELLEAVTRRSARQDEIVAIPAGDQLADYFVIDEDSVRQRTLLTLPSRIHPRVAFIRSVLNAFLHLRGDDSDVRKLLRASGYEPSRWSFLLGYVYQKQEGLDLKRALNNFYRNSFGGKLKMEFLSGAAPKNQISRILQKALEGDIDILLANMVISLGIDIHGLNHIIMYGVPRGYTEYVQTTGRTGRGDSPGFINIILLPSSARDVYLYRHFHAILSDVAGYYDVLPVRSTNLHCSEEIFGNIAKAVLSALCMQKPVWTNRDGVRQATGRREDRLRGGIVRLLCDDTSLLEETKSLVLRRYRRLMDEFQSQSEFLGKFMQASDPPWLIYRLRGGTGQAIKVTCSDQILLERIGTSDSHSNGDSAEGVDE
jgi:hypothetical protein